MTASESIHFHILEDIARDLSGEVNFPTCLDAAILVRNTLKDPFANLEQVVQAIGVEPLISSKLLRLANSVIYNPRGEHISDLGSTIRRLGYDIVRTTSLAVALDQMLKSRNLVAYDRLAKETWENSIQVAAIARVLARHLGRIQPDTAMLAGLVHNIGIFYLMYRAAEYLEYRNNEPGMIELIAGWHEGVGESLLHILGVPESITDAVREQNNLRSLDAPCSVSDVLYFAKLLATNTPFLPATQHNTKTSAETREALQARYAELLKEAQDDVLELRATLSS